MCACMAGQFAGRLHCAKAKLLKFKESSAALIVFAWAFSFDKRSAAVYCMSHGSIYLLSEVA